MGLRESLIVLVADLELGVQATDDLTELSGGLDKLLNFVFPQVLVSFGSRHRMSSFRSTPHVREQPIEAGRSWPMGRFFPFALRNKKGGSENPPK